MKSKFLSTAFAAILGMGILAGCSEDAKKDFDAAGENMGKAADQVGDGIATDASKATEGIREGAADAAKATENAGVTGKVKSALMAAEGIDSEHINVDTIGNTITLKGSIDSETAKKKAGDLAQTIAGSEYKVDNQLTTAKSSPADPTGNNR